MSRPISIALITPFAYQPFKSIRLLCDVISKVVPDGQTEVITITPPSFLGDLTQNISSVHRWASAFERLTLSPMLLRLKLQRLARLADKARRDFYVLFSDQSVALMGNALTGFKVVTMVNDLIAMRAALEGIAGNSSFGQRFLQRATLSGLYASSAYVTPSAATAADLASYFPESPPRTAVAPLPIFNTVRPILATELARRSNDLWRTQGVIPPSYILNVGSSAWYKNRTGVIRIAAELKKTNPVVPALVFAGAEPTAEESALIKSAGIRFYYFSNVTPDDLNTLYSGAECLLMPSYVEGFGVPALEALTAGAPLVITDTSSLVECFGGAAAVVLPIPAPETHDAWAVEAAKEIQELIELSAEEKQKMIAYGIQLSASFTPQRFREGLLRGLSLCG